MKDLFDDIDEKFYNKTDYETRCNIVSLVKNKSLEFLLWAMEKYTYHLNFGFRDENGESWEPIQIYNKFITDEKS